MLGSVKEVKKKVGEYERPWRNKMAKSPTKEEIEAKQKEEEAKRLEEEMLMSRKGKKRGSSMPDRPNSKTSQRTNMSKNQKLGMKKGRGDDELSIVEEDAQKKEWKMPSRTGNETNK